MIPFSVLDLAPIVQGGTAGEALHASRDLALHAESLGYRRFWLAEHHGMAGIASAATAVAIAFVAGATSTIRVGSGGIMLPNHAPLVIAEQFGTLESLFPRRIDLGLGRAPGTDTKTALALRRGRINTVDTFPQDLGELQEYLHPAQHGQAVVAVPGAGLSIPIWLLGSSLFSARLAAARGLPYAFAAHFAPDLLMNALDLYRTEFQPSESLAQPYALVAIPVFAADHDEEANRLFTSVQQSFLNLHRGRAGPLPPPVDTMDGIWSPAERASIRRTFREAVVGSPQRVREGIAALLQKTHADELMISSPIHDPAARHHSLSIVAQTEDFREPPSRPPENIQPGLSRSPGCE